MNMKFLIIFLVFCAVLAVAQYDEEETSEFTKIPQFTLSHNTKRSTTPKPNYCDFNGLDLLLSNATMSNSYDPLEEEDMDVCQVKATNFGYAVECKDTATISGLNMGPEKFEPPERIIFWMPSTHKINDEVFDLEMQFTITGHNSDKEVELHMLYKEGNSENDALEDLLKIKDEFHKFNPTSLFPKRKRHFNYTICDDIKKSNIVFEDIMSVTKEEVKKFKKRYMGEVTPLLGVLSDVQLYYNACGIITIDGVLLTCIFVYLFEICVFELFACAYFGT